MVIMFLMVLLIIGLMFTAPAIKTEIQRDRGAGNDPSRSAILPRHQEIL